MGTAHRRRHNDLGPAQRSEARRGNAASAGEGSTNAPTSHQSRIERCLANSRRLGSPATTTKTLRSFARQVQTTGEGGPLTAGVMAEWARQVGS